MSWATLLAAPHRLPFLLGGTQALLVMAVWSFDLLARHAGAWPVPVWPWPPGWLHGLFLLFTVFAPFIFGFLLTAGPRWIGQPDTPQTVYRLPLQLLMAGVLLADLGMLSAPLLPMALALQSAAWLLVLRNLLALTRRASGDRWHIGLVSLAFAAGLGGLLLWLGGLLSSQASLIAVAVELTFWAWLMPTFIVVLHRMLPFFTASALRGYVVRRPGWPLAMLLIAAWAHATAFTLPIPWAAWLWLLDLAAALAAAWLAWHWWPHGVTMPTILRVLHLAFLWCGVGFLLAAADGLLLLTTGTGLGRAALHALAIGFGASTWIGMASRVTRGHSGRPIVGDRFMETAFWLMQGATGLRIASELVGTASGWLLILAALTWWLAAAIWLTRHAGMLTRPLDDRQ